MSTTWWTNDNTQANELRGIELLCVGVCSVPTYEHAAAAVTEARALKVMCHTGLLCLQAAMSPADCRVL